MFLPEFGFTLKANGAHFFDLLSTPYFAAEISLGWGYNFSSI